MNLTNYHSHCLFCDGRADMDEFIRFAISKGFTSYGVSSHAPLPFSTHWSMEWGQIENYLNEFNRVKQVYKSQIEFYVGLEVDYLNDLSNPSSICFQQLPLDYIIGSVHLLYNDKQDVIDIDVAPPIFADIVNQHFYGDLDKVIRMYFERQFRMLELGGFDILGHADKMHYNAMCYRPGLLEEKWYNDLVEDFFKKVANYGYIVEINTKAYNTYHTFFPNEKYFALLHELGIRVMVNSDSHYPDRINAGRLEALKCLKDCGFETVVERYDNKWKDVMISL